MYDVCAMKRTNIYLEDSQLDLLGRVAEERGTSVAFLVRAAVESWIRARGLKVMPPDEWERRFAALLERRRKDARRRGLTQERVDKAVDRAIREVRGARRARRP